MMATAVQSSIIPPRLHGKHSLSPTDLSPIDQDPDVYLLDSYENAMEKLKTAQGFESYASTLTKLRLMRYVEKKEPKKIAYLFFFFFIRIPSYLLGLHLNILPHLEAALVAHLKTIPKYPVYIENKEKILLDGSQIPQDKLPSSNIIQQKTALALPKPKINNLPPKAPLVAQRPVTQPVERIVSDRGESSPLRHVEKMKDRPRERIDDLHRRERIEDSQRRERIDERPRDDRPRLVEDRHYRDDRPRERVEDRHPRDRSDEYRMQQRYEEDLERQRHERYDARRYEYEEDRQRRERVKENRSLVVDHRTPTPPPPPPDVNSKVFYKNTGSDGYFRLDAFGEFCHRRESDSSFILEEIFKMAGVARCTDPIKYKLASYSKKEILARFKEEGRPSVTIEDFCCSPPERSDGNEKKGIMISLEDAKFVIGLIDFKGSTAFSHLMKPIIDIPLFSSQSPPKPLVLPSYEMAFQKRPSSASPSKIPNVLPTNIVNQISTSASPMDLSQTQANDGFFVDTVGQRPTSSSPLKQSLKPQEPTIENSIALVRKIPGPIISLSLSSTCKEKKLLNLKTKLAKARNDVLTIEKRSTDKKTDISLETSRLQQNESDQQSQISLLERKIGDCERIIESYRKDLLKLKTELETSKRPIPERIILEALRNEFVDIEQELFRARKIEMDIADELAKIEEQEKNEEGSEARRIASQKAAKEEEERVARENIKEANRIAALKKAKEEEERLEKVLKKKEDDEKKRVADQKVKKEEERLACEKMVELEAIRTAAFKKAKDEEERQKKADFEIKRAAVYQKAKEEEEKKRIEIESIRIAVVLQKEKEAREVEAKRIVAAAQKLKLDEARAAAAQKLKLDEARAAAAATAAQKSKVDAARAAAASQKSKVDEARAFAKSKVDEARAFAARVHKEAEEVKRVAAEKRLVDEKNFAISIAAKSKKDNRVMVVSDTSSSSSSSSSESLVNAKRKRLCESNGSQQVKKSKVDDDDPLSLPEEISEDAATIRERLFNSMRKGSAVAVGKATPEDGEIDSESGSPVNRSPVNGNNVPNQHQQQQHHQQQQYRLESFDGLIMTERARQNNESSNAAMVRLVNPSNLKIDRTSLSNLGLNVDNSTLARTQLFLEAALSNSQHQLATEGQNINREGVPIGALPVYGNAPTHTPMGVAAYPPFPTQFNPFLQQQQHQQHQQHLNPQQQQFQQFYSQQQQIPPNWAAYFGLLGSNLPQPPMQPPMMPPPPPLPSNNGAFNPFQYNRPS